MGDFRTAISTALKIMSYKLTFGTYSFSLFQAMLGLFGLSIVIGFVVNVFSGNDD